MGHVMPHILNQGHLKSYWLGKLIFFPLKIH